MIYLQAFADPDGNGTADALYFPNRHLPMRADFFNYISWQLATRYKARFTHGCPYWGSICRTAGRPGHFSDKKVFYTRLTPFDAENRRIINEIYEDLASHAPLMGIIFHDDRDPRRLRRRQPGRKSLAHKPRIADRSGTDPERPETHACSFTRAKSRH